MPDFLISSGKNVADFPYLFQKLRFRISHLLLERVQKSKLLQAVQVRCEYR